jgi:hypothetical protein
MVRFFLWLYRSRRICFFRNQVLARLPTSGQPDDVSVDFHTTFHSVVLGLLAINLAQKAGA